MIVRTLQVFRGGQAHRNCDFARVRLLCGTAPSFVLLLLRQDVAHPRPVASSSWVSEVTYSPKEGSNDVNNFYEVDDLKRMLNRADFASTGEM